MYEFKVYNFATDWLPRPGVYIFAHEHQPGYWSGHYVGTCGSFKDRITVNHHKWGLAKVRGATHVHALVHHGGEAERFAIERDLIERLQPSCNDTFV
jgi:hypothetical protein